ncbi:MAG: multidrug ABC transporter substrate-binding protein [Acidobacteria bacterium]|nr:MAG: multidrug ABC transporter substrate-binding protein [Acidobacteriota bacterium]
MKLLASLRSLASAVFHRARVDSEMEEELRAHVRNRADDLERSGSTRAEAERQARIEFGAHEKFKEECREERASFWLETLWPDVRYGARMLRKNPGFTAVALMTVAIGIGANAAVFSVVNSVLLKPLPYPNADELVSLHQVAPGAAGLADFENGLLLSPSMYFTYAEQNRTFQSLGVWTTDISNVTGIAEPEQVRAVVVSDGVLQALGVPPRLGRWLMAADQVPRGPQRVMLSYGYWQRRFGGDPGVVGRNIMVDSQSTEIVGVMPKGFRFVDTNFDLLEPAQLDRSKLILAGFGYHGIALLKPGARIAEANADMARMVPIWMDSWTNGPKTDPHIYETWKITPVLRPLKQEVIGNVSEVLWVVMGTIGLVMLIACANVTNLLLVRVEARQQELAVRAALGAGRGRMIRGGLVESLLLGLMGGMLGVAVAYNGVRFLVAMGPANLPRLSEISVDAPTLGFILLLSVVSSLFFGLIPALKYAGPQTSLVLVSAGRTTSTSRERHRARNLLVIGQVAMALVLLVSAGLMIRTFQALRIVDPGFADARHLQLMRIGIPDSLIHETQRVMRTQNEILDRLAVIPGVQSAAFASEMPMEGFDSDWDTIFIEGKPYHKGEIPPLHFYKHVSPGFLAATGAHIISGRDFTWDAVYGLRPVVMVSENLAREAWGTAQNAIGKRLTEDPGLPWREVIGVVQDVPEKGVQEKAPAIVYWPPLVENLFGKGPAQPTRVVTFVVRTERAGTESLLREMRQAVWSVNANLPLASVRTMQEVYDKSMARTSFTLVMLGIAGALALVLGLTGIYGVISYTVSQRQREIGIRLALGAQRQNVLQMVLGQGAKMALVGVLIGTGVAFALTRLMTGLLVGVTAHDPITFAGVGALLFLVALVACYLPARRAMRVDPMVALRHE